MKVNVYIDSSFHPATSQAQAGCVWFYNKQKHNYVSEIYESENATTAEIQGIFKCISEVLDVSNKKITQLHIINDNKCAVALVESFIDIKQEVLDKYPTIGKLKSYCEMQGIYLTTEHSTRQNKFIKEADKLSKTWRKRGTRTK